MWRSIIGVSCGLVLATLMAMVGEVASRKVYPLPNGTDPHEYHQLAAYMEEAPSGSFLIVLAGWVVGTLLCGLLIGIITRRKAKDPSIVAGVLLLSAAVTFLFLYPHPNWFRILAILTFIPVVYIGHWLGNKITATHD